MMNLVVLHFMHRTSLRLGTCSFSLSIGSCKVLHI